MADTLLALVEKSAETDLAFLLKAKEEAKKRMQTNPSPDAITAFNKAREAVEEESARLSGLTSSRAYKTQLDAVAYLKDSGFKLSKSQFNRDVKARKIPTNAEGYFEESALLGYAASNLTATGQLENKSMSEATTNRLSADAELKKFQAERVKLKLEKEQGLLMPRSEHERDLAARALFFKNEVQNFIYLHGGAIIHLVGGEETNLPILVEWWQETTANWMDTWAQEREFTVEIADEDSEEGAE